VRIFRALLAILLIIIFVALLVSAYTQYNLTLSTVGLVDATTSITNHLALYSLAHESGGNVQEYVIDPARIPSLEFSQEVGGENFEFQFTISYQWGRVLGPSGPMPPEGRAFCAFSTPVVVYENNRFEYAKLEVKVWHA
jgi:hypothetical protein